MTTTKPPMPEIKPVATFLERGKVITWEFISPDGHVLAGYRSVPEATGFPAWEQCGDLIMGFSERVLRWFPTEDAARTWVLSRVSVAHPSAAAADVVSGSTQQEKAA